MEPDSLFWQCCILNGFLTAIHQLSFWRVFTVKQDASFSVISFPGSGFSRLRFCLWRLQLVWIGKLKTGRGLFCRCMFCCGCVLTSTKPRNSSIMFSKSWESLTFLTATMLSKTPKPRGQPWYVFLSCDWVAGAVQRPLNFTRTISAIHLITSVFVVFVPEKKVIQTLPRYSKASRTWTLKFPSRIQSTLCSRRAVVKPLERRQMLKLKKHVMLSGSEFSMGIPCLIF